MECIELLNYLIEETENVKSPMNLAQLARDFKEKSGTALTEEGLKSRFVMCMALSKCFHFSESKKRVTLFIVLITSTRTRKSECYLC